MEPDKEFKPLRGGRALIFRLFSGEIEMFLNKFSVGADEVGQDAQHPQQKSENQKNRRQQKRLNMSAPVAAEEKVQIPKAQRQPKYARHKRRIQKCPQRFIGNVRPQDNRGGAADIAGRRGNQTGRAGLRIDADRHRADSQVHMSGLNNRFKGVGISVEYMQFHGGFSGIRPKAAGGIRDVRTRELADNQTADLLKFLFAPAEVFDGFDGPCSDNDVEFARKDRPNQFRDAAAVILVIAVRVDDNVGTQLGGILKPSQKRKGQPPIGAERKNMMNPKPAG